MKIITEILNYILRIESNYRANHLLLGTMSKK